MNEELYRVMLLYTSSYINSKCMMFKRISARDNYDLRERIFLSLSHNNVAFFLDHMSPYMLLDRYTAFKSVMLSVRLRPSSVSHAIYARSSKSVYGIERRKRCIPRESKGSLWPFNGSFNSPVFHDNDLRAGVKSRVNYGVAFSSSRSYSYTDATRRLPLV